MCPALPAELCGEVFTHLDEFTVWMMSRNVSKLWRAEAEREFARNRLPQLYFKWNFRIFGVQYESKDYDYLVCCKTIQMAAISTNSETVSFEVRFKYQLHKKGYQSHEEDMTMKP
jgi:hypothetical protein